MKKSSAAWPLFGATSTNRDALPHSCSNVGPPFSKRGFHGKLTVAFGV